MGKENIIDYNLDVETLGTYHLDKPLLVRKNHNLYTLHYKDYGDHEHIFLRDVNFGEIVKIINIYNHNNLDEGYREFNSLNLEVLEYGEWNNDKRNETSSL